MNCYETGMNRNYAPPCSLPAAQAAVTKSLHRKISAMPYPDVVNLPFNRSELPSGFTLYHTPDRSAPTEAHWVLLHGANLLVRDAGQALELLHGPLPQGLENKRPPLCYASWNGQPVCALSVSTEAPLPDGLTAEPFNAFRERIPPSLMTVAGIGKQLIHWQQTSRFCSRCGGRPEQLPDSWGKRCAGCGTELFPQIHPCAIVLIKRDDQLLLIRKPEWAKGRYSLVAGFLDVGESLEECAVREAQEETGVTIKNVRYLTSQSWPFPSQLMAGFVADYAYGDIKIDDKEIDDARWFSIDALPDLPASRSIARWLIDRYSRHTP